METSSHGPVYGNSVGMNCKLAGRLLWFGLRRNNDRRKSILEYAFTFDGGTTISWRFKLQTVVV